MDHLIATKHELLLDHAEQRSEGARLVMAVLRTAALLDRECGARLAQFDVSEARFAVLLAAAAHDPATPAALAERLDITRAAVTGLVDGLVGQGFAIRAAVPEDRRSFTVAVTPAGRAVLDALRPVYGGWLTQLTATLDPASVGPALTALGEIQRALDPESARG
ncbi:MarR family winged helix-turn-helix transcriptional regulator [Leucobacter luti]|uniref:DNA-binding MarR family transcriptional regulator n=1 Tax=Leucobacter luti TaxID=340320 RepID=A0A4Q7TZR5_9MICO|nr:MarR family transcriptional regulator [Leucobacter luti]MBL3698742.1 MarR family transcriptional regulator [Leucobacter luti]RZT66117.1 DNA-binding MarR family transcriptional regulator [Leucobacter luti]